MVAKNGLAWEEPPPHGAHRGVSHALVSAELKKKPGQWARAFTYPTAVSASSTAHMIRAGRSRSWSPAGAFEAVARTVDGEHHVFVRYLGDPK